MEALNTLAKLYIAKGILVFVLIIISPFAPRLIVMIFNILNKISDKMARK